MHQLAGSKDPFSFLVPILYAIALLYDRSVWLIRDRIRDIEKNRANDTAAEPDFSAFHEIGRHAIHSTETLAAAAQSIQTLLKEHEKFVERTLAAQNDLGADPSVAHLNSQLQIIENLKLRSQANEKRLQNEITLAYNLIAQRDSKIMMDLGKAAKSDGGAMKAIAIVTMAFLPATFTSAIFSMSFFNFSPDGANGRDEWTVSGKIWIYWVVAISLTLLTLLAWLVVRENGPKKFFAAFSSLGMEQGGARRRAMRNAVEA
ncbi:MAG: hypothetical protein Q9227_000561 [Pyrenula ochraceoflavens]